MGGDVEAAAQRLVEHDPLTAQIQAGLAIVIRKKSFFTSAVCLKGRQLIQPPFPLIMQSTAIFENPQVPLSF